MQIGIKVKSRIHFGLVPKYMPSCLFQFFLFHTCWLTNIVTDSQHFKLHVKVKSRPRMRLHKYYQMLFGVKDFL